jgi:hypothetical protein
MSNLYFLCLLAALWAGSNGQMLAGIREGGLSTGELPVITVIPTRSILREVDVGRRTTPEVFQYKIVPTRGPTRYPPWVSDAVTDGVVAGGATCAEILAKNRRILFRDGLGVVREIPLEPVPLEQVFVPANTKLTTDTPGIQRNRLSSCCDAEACLDRCLAFPSAQAWFLEIGAPSYGVDDIVVVRGAGRVNQGGTGTNDVVYIKQDPGVWPVMRIACRYCPLTSCITNCSNGEYATGFADLSVRRFPCVFVFIGRKPDPRSRQTGMQVNRLECKPCAPGTWNTCKEKANCRWFIPQGLDNTLGDDIHVFPGGPGQASFFYLESSGRRARDARLFRVQCRPATPARR